MNKQQYLDKLKHPTQNRYKRARVGLVGYIGGKTNQVGNILENIPDDIGDVCSPFIGGGAVECAIAKYMDKQIYCYDFNKPLICFYKVLQKDRSKLIRNIQKYTYILNMVKSKNKKYLPALTKFFNECKKDLLDYFDGNKQMTDMEVAVKAFFNLKLGFGGMFMKGGMVFKTVSSDLYKSSNNLNNVDMNNMLFDCQPFDVSIPKHNNDFIYADPPYWLGDTSHMKAGLYLNHDKFDHGALHDLLKKHKGKFLLSYNDCDYIRDKYNWCNIETPAEYSYGPIGAGKKCKKSKELIIMNY